MDYIHPRIKREMNTVNLMIRMYCRDHHDCADGLCADCTSLAEYSRSRLVNCPFKDEKPPCSKCKVHCYSPEKRERIREVMRYAGPKMIWEHPVAAFRHILDKLRYPGK